MATILTICPYKLLPLRGGGALRSFHILRQLAQRHEVHAIIFQSEKELRTETEGYRVPDNVRIYSPVDTPPPPSFFDKLPFRTGPGLHYRWLRRNWRGPAQSSLLRCYHIIDRILENHEINAVVFEHIQTMTAAPIIQRRQPDALRILNAHNVDHQLIRQHIDKAKVKNERVDLKEKPFQQALWTEQHLNRFVNSFWACSDDDRVILESMNDMKGFTIPNGVDTDYFAFDQNPGKNGSLYIIFSGWMGTDANIDALRYLADEIWPILIRARPRLKLLVVGDGMSKELHAYLSIIPGIEITGEVSDVRPYFRKAALSIVPLRIGSGTRLKILEAMSQGVPIVSTHLGAGGINAVDGKHLLLADTPDEFADVISKLLNDPSLFDAIQNEARRFVEYKYDWHIIGERMNESIQALFDQPVFLKNKELRTNN